MFHLCPVADDRCSSACESCTSCDLGYADEKAIRLQGMATYVSDKFDAEAAGYWARYTTAADAEAGFRFTVFNNNKIYVRVGSKYFAIWQQSE